MLGHVSPWHLPGRFIKYMLHVDPVCNNYLSPRPCLMFGPREQRRRSTSG